jgi:hypothetical protein
MDGAQAGDPDKFAALLLRLVAAQEPPTLLFAGTDAFKRASSQIEIWAKEMDTWKTMTTSTDY